MRPTAKNTIGHLKSQELFLNGSFNRSFNSSSCSKLFVHLVKSLLVDVINNCNAYELAYCTQHIKRRNEPAKASRRLGRLTDSTEGGNVADNGSTHKSDYCCGTNTLSELSEEGVKRVNNAFLSLTGLPLLVVDSITHHSPGYAVVESHTETEEYKSEHINDELCALGAKREDAKDRTADKTCDRAYGSDLLLTVLLNELGSEGHKDEHGEESDHLNDSREGCLTEVSCEHNGGSGW